MNGSIVVIGSINMDLVCDSPRIPRPGETVLGTSLAYYPGGKGANQAVAAARLGGNTRLIGMLGDDAFALPLRKSLVDAGVNIESVGIAQGSSGTAIIAADPQGQNAIIVIPGSNAKLTPATIDELEPIIKNASVILVQLEIPLETVIRAAEIASEAKVPFILDPAPARTLPPQLLKMVTWITPNETEAEELIGKDAGGMSSRERAHALLDMGVQGVVLKRGERGVFLMGGNVSSLDLSAPTVRPVDTTAAGDAFNGAFAFSLNRGSSVEQSARYAVVAATVSVTRRGAQPSLPTETDVLAMLRVSELGRAIA